MPKKLLYVIDGHNVLYRAHFAFQQNPLINTRKRDVSVAFGFARMLLTLLRDRNPEYMAIAFDRKAPTFRHELYRQYKLNRPPMPAPIADNLMDIQSIVRALGIRILEKDGYEADDLLGSLVELFAKEDIHVYLISKDKDMLQLVGDNVSVLSTRQGLSDLTEFRRAEVIEKYGISPDKMLDYFSIVGDAVDNVPGISGVGPKTAVKLLTEFDSLEGIYQHADSIKGKIGEKIRNDREFAFLARQLIALRLDADLSPDIEDYKIQPMHKPDLKRLFEELEFKSLIKMLGLDEALEAGVKKAYHTISTREDLLELARRARLAREIAVDTETSGLDVLTCRLVGISISFLPGEAFYVPIGHQTIEPQVSLDDVRSILGPVLGDPHILKIGQNTKFDRHILEQHGFKVMTPWFDTMLADYLIDSGRRHHNLDLLADVYLSESKTPTEKILGKGSKAITMDLASIESVSEYACEDADVTFRLYPILREKLVQEQMTDLYHTIEMPLVDVLMDIERTGIALDSELLSDLAVDLKTQLATLEDDIWCIAGERFNINSPGQLATILFEKLGYPSRGLKKTKSGISTAESELKKLVVHGGLFRELPEKILEYRSLTKLIGTYLEPLPALINPDTGRLHTTFNQATAETGRLSSSNPNLQNIPIRNPLGRDIRRAFIPSPGNVMISADYSQMELRILAHVAEDNALIESFLNGLDIHTATASRIFHVPVEQVTPEQRRRAKTVNFGIDYGMTPFGLSDRLGISVDEARDYIDEYLKQFSGVRQYIESTQQQVSQNGWVATLMGRKRPIPMAMDANRNIREMGFRQAINMRIQGTAADIIKMAMIRLYRELNTRNLQSKMVLQIHDELLFDVVPGEHDELRMLIREIMEHAFPLCVPLRVDLKTGYNWSDAH
ncbi:DNA polymerase I [bacterium]|nr:DNA polymerase I [candidate division CSSED10-310 bacterium]